MGNTVDACCCSDDAETQQDNKVPPPRAAHSTSAIAKRDKKLASMLEKMVEFAEASATTQAEAAKHDNAAEADGCDGFVEITSISQDTTCTSPGKQAKGAKDTSMPCPAPPPAALPPCTPRSSSAQQRQRTQTDGNSANASTLPLPPPQPSLPITFKLPDSRSKMILFSHTPLGFNFAKSPPYTVHHVEPGGHADTVGVCSGWEIITVGSQDISNMAGKDLFGFLKEKLTLLPNRGKPSPAKQGK
eukprot:TRINITY_DN62031_c0_g1_i1.p1 TRINITY_DN62031_c0_g1~~TRINITY_DN62031_c0_g1_i1.p1  ORF type:complete len:245 (-),score=56.46 TRINITY_DN62031_c0_g1_i1:179-913(-)